MIPHSCESKPDCSVLPNKVLIPKDAFLNLHLSISNDIVSTKIYDKLMFPTLHPMESISLNPIVLLEHLAMLLTSKLTINC